MKSQTALAGACIACATLAVLAGPNDRSRSTTGPATPGAGEPAPPAEGGPLCTKNVGILGSYFRSEVTAFLTAESHTVSNVTAADIAAGILASLDVLYINRLGTADAASEAAAIEAWVRGGGILITELSATQQLFDGATYGFFAPATLVNPGFVPSGNVCGLNDMVVEDPGNILAQGLPATWCSGDPYGVFQSYDESTLDPAVKPVIRVAADGDGDGLNDIATASACIDDGAIVMHFCDFGDWTALAAACGTCNRVPEEEQVFRNAVCLALDKCAAPSRCLDQPPSPVFGPFSDIDCDATLCNDPIQVLADNFILTEPESIDSVRFWGAYFGGAAPQFDRFTVAFWTDAGGLPGSIINKMGPRPATTRELTGNQIFGFPEYEYTIDLEPNKNLQPGTYWIEIYNDTSACPWDCDPAGPDGIVGITDFLGLLAQWGTPGTCDFNGGGVGIVDFLKLLSHWGPCPVTNDAWIWEDGIVDPVAGIPGIAFSFQRNNTEVWQPEEALDLSLNFTCKLNPFGCPGEGDCCAPNGTPGCDNTDCCRRVCAIDPFCCDIEWDQLCADEALQFPQCECVLCTNDCGTGNLPEGEPCLVDGDIDTTNGGCNSMPAVYGFASCGDTVCGTASTFDLNTRDTDWYCVDLPDPDGDGVEELRATLSSEFNGVCFITDDGGCPDGAGCAPLVVGATGSSIACEPTSDAFACLPAPATYVVFVAPADFTGVPCVEGANDYTVSITCNPCPPGAQPSPALDAETSAKLLAPTAK